MGVGYVEWGGIKKKIMAGKGMCEYRIRIDVIGLGRWVCGSKEMGWRKIEGKFF